MKLKLFFSFLIWLTVVNSVLAQQGFGTANPNQNAVIEILTSNKGLLIPRVALSASNLAAPLSQHVAGMMLYNTATSGISPNDVVPGYYFNNGSKWVRVLQTSEKAWYNAATNTPASTNTQDIYQSAKVGIGTNTPLSPLHIKGDGINDPLVIQQLLPASNSTDNKMMMINNSTGIITYTNIPPPDSHVLQTTIGSQTFNAASFATGSSVLNATQVSFAAADVLLASNFATLSGNVLTISKAGDYDLTATCNLLMPKDANYAGVSPLDNSFMNVTLEMQMRTSSAGAWQTIASNTNTMNYTSFGLISTLKPIITLQTLVAGSQLQLIIYRGAGIYRTGATAPSTGATGSGIVQNKLFKLTRYN